MALGSLTAASSQSSRACKGLLMILTIPGPHRGHLTLYEACSLRKVTSTDVACVCTQLVLNQCWPDAWSLS